MDVRSLFAAQEYAAARPATEADPRQERASRAEGVLADFTATLQAAERTSEAAITGNADPHALVEALAQSELAVETAVTVRNRVVEAYQEILRMPV